MSELDQKEILKNIFEVERPWGKFRQYTHNQATTVKIITVAAGQMLSLQTHRKRDELWIVLDDGLRVQVDERIWQPLQGDEILIMRGSKHRLSSVHGQGKILEIAFGEFDENDIE